MSRSGWSSRVPKESNGGVPVNIQDQTSRILDLFFIQKQGATVTLGAAANPNDRTITLSDATGFVTGNVVGLFGSATQFMFAKQIGIPAGNVITLDTPVDTLFPIGSAVIRATDNLNVNGSPGTPQIFSIGPIGTGAGIEVDITRFLGYIETSGAQADDKFGDIAGGLQYGLALRQNNGSIQNIWNVKTNGEIGLLCYDSAYTPNAPAGNEGFRFRNTFAGQSKHGVTIRLMPGESLELLVQDNLSGLVKLNCMAQGHVVTD